MAGKKQTAPESGGRLAAYTARNRTSLIKATQAVLAEAGLEATIEQLATNGQVSPTTIYNLFESKENLLAAALEDAWGEWVMWAYDGDQAGQSLQDMMNVCRKLFRAKATHPQFAKILNKTLDDPAFVLKAVSAVGMADLKTVTANEKLAIQDFEKQSYLWAYSLAGILHQVYVAEEASPEDADYLLELSLQIFGISKVKAKKLTSQQLSF
jgi:AcrR family transcriptional regulator